MAPIRRARSVPKNLGSEAHEMSQDPSHHSQNEQYSQPEQENLSRFSIRRIVNNKHDIVMNPGDRNKYMIIIRVIRVIQILIGPILISLNAVLLSRYTSLRASCSNSNDCEIYRKAVGAFKYCIVPGILGIIQGIWGLIATYMNPLPPLHFVVGVDNTVAGFYMGGGCTLAAILNGWKCDRGDDAGRRMCSQFYASIAFFFLGVVLSYGMVPAWCYLRTRLKRQA